MNSPAFDISERIPPSSWFATVLRGTVNFTPATTSLQAIAWSEVRGAGAGAGAASAKLTVSSTDDGCQLCVVRAGHHGLAAR